MLFNSTVFVVFFALVYALYLSLRRRFRAQNLLLLIASYVFYGYWDWRFLGLVALSTLIDYVVALKMAATDDPRRRRRLLVVSIGAGLVILGFFKYFNFFAGSFVRVLELLGLPVNYVALHIVLPVGISFYTFQTMSYTIDVYRGKMEPARNLLEFALFVAFFPQLVAGPIERAENLLPQIAAPRRIGVSKLHIGIHLLLWGYFKKLVIADNLGTIADTIFGSWQMYDGLDLALGVLCFTFQIYCDFSGYSDIARGLANLLGFELMVNFKLPYFSLSPSEFWQRWHISLSTWLRDYLYIPLGGNRHGVLNTYRNLFLTMLLGGLWHGAAWNFVAWGAFHGLLLIAYRPFEARRRAALPGGTVAPWLLMTGFTLIGWVLFRARSLPQALYFITHAGLGWSPETATFLAVFVGLTLPLVAMEVYQHRRGDLLAAAKWPTWALAALYVYLLLSIGFLAPRAPVDFVYFQF